MFMKAGMKNEYRDEKSYKLINLTKLLNAKKNNSSIKNMNFEHKKQKSLKHIYFYMFFRAGTLENQ